MRISTIAATALALLLGCSSNPVRSSRSRHGLYAELRAPQLKVKHLEDLRINATLHNDGPADTTVNRYVLNNSVLALEVRDADGHVLPPLPPSPPPSDLRRYDTLLRAGDSLSFGYELFYQAPIPSGNYTVGMRGMPSDQLVISVEGGR